MIGCLTTSFPRFESDYAGSFVLQMARAFAARGHEIEVVAPSDPETRTDDAWLPAGISVRRVRYAWPDSLQKLFYGAGAPDNLRMNPVASAGVLPALLQFYRAVKSSRYDRLISHWLIPSSFAAAAASGGRPHLAFAHSSDVHMMARLPFAGRMAAFVASRSTRTGFSSQGLKEKFLNLMTDRNRRRLENSCIHLPVGVVSPFENFRPDRQKIRESMKLNGFVVLCMGRFVPVKGYDVLLRAAGRHLADAYLIFAGEGPDERALHDFARNMGVKAFFPGVVMGSRKAELFAAADAFCAPSRVLRDGRREGTPVSVLEAQAAGLPVVACRSGGIESIIEHGKTGLLAGPDDVDALGSALKKLRYDPLLSRNLVVNAQRCVQGRTWNCLMPLYENALLL